MLQAQAAPQAKLRDPKGFLAKRTLRRLLLAPWLDISNHPSISKHPATRHEDDTPKQPPESRSQNPTASTNTTENPNLRSITQQSNTSNKPNNGKISKGGDKGRERRCCVEELCGKSSCCKADRGEEFRNKTTNFVMSCQAGIAHCGGLMPLLKLLDSKNGSLQHNAAFALYGLTDNEDNAADFIRLGGVQKLQEGEFISQATNDCVAKTLKRLEDKIHGRVLSHLLYLMWIGENSVQRRIALALAHLCSPNDRKLIFLDSNGLGLLIGLLGSSSVKQQVDSAVALYKLARKALTQSPMDAAPQSPISQKLTFYSPNSGKRFYAHRICLLASSDTFRAMFDGGYREKDARDIVIPNIRWEVSELMMRFIYTGSVNISLDIAQDLLRAAGQYLLERLKRLCEYTIAKDTSVENVGNMYELSEAYHAVSLRHTCILFILEHHEKLIAMPRQSELLKRILPDIHDYFVEILTQPTSACKRPTPAS
ncbi:hypothetical protein Drorol1_Dr00007873 [Drosera rotundifolia]